MKRKQQLAVASISFACGFVFASLPCVASAASGHNSLIPETLYNKTVAQFPISQSIFTDMGFQQNKSIICSIPEASLLESWINLFARLLIISSVGYLGINRYSSSFERYLQVVSRDFLLIAIKVFLFLTLVSMGIITLSILVSSHSTPSPTHPRFNCRL